MTSLRVDPIFHYSAAGLMRIFCCRDVTLWRLRSTLRKNQRCVDACRMLVLSETP